MKAWCELLDGLRYARGNRDCIEIQMRMTRGGVIGDKSGVFYGNPGFHGASIGKIQKEP